MVCLRLKRHVLRDRPFNLKGGWGGMDFCFVQELEYLFFLSRKAQIFFLQNLTLGYMTKTLNQIFFFPPPKSEFFFRKKP